MLQRKVVRHFSGKNFREHTNTKFKSQGILKVKDLVKHQSACFMSNVHLPSQIPLSYLGAKTENKKLHSKSPPLKSTHYHFPAYCLPKIWNDLPLTYKNSDSTRKFKDNLKEY